MTNQCHHPKLADGVGAAEDDRMAEGSHTQISPLAKSLRLIGYTSAHCRADVRQWLLHICGLDTQGWKESTDADYQHITDMLHAEHCVESVAISLY